MPATDELEHPQDESMQDVDAGESHKKPRKVAQHPSPPWKEDNWRFTRALLELIADPRNELARRALWPKEGEDRVQGSKIVLQTDLAKRALADWDAEKVTAEPRWYGNRVKDWLQKLRKRYIDCDKEARLEGVPAGLHVDEWALQFPALLARLEQKCPVYRQLDGLLGGGGSQNIGAELEGVDAGPARLSHIGTGLTHNGPESHRLLPEQVGGIAGPSSLAQFSGSLDLPIGMEWISPEATSSLSLMTGKPKRARSNSHSSDGSLDRESSSSRQALKLRRLEQDHERIMRQVNTAHELALAKERNEENERVRTFELEKLRLQIKLAELRREEKSRDFM